MLVYLHQLSAFQGDNNFCELIIDSNLNIHSADEFSENEYELSAVEFPFMFLYFFTYLLLAQVPIILV
jgi:hypothetical protein